MVRGALAALLSREQDIEVVAEVARGDEVVQAALATQPDVALLDIEMPGLDGFQVLSELSPREMPVVVFTSAYDQYAIRAFEAHALDYLLKPFDQARLHQAIERVRSELHKSQSGAITHRILDLLSRVESERLIASEQEKRLVIKARGRVVFLDLDEIDWVEAAANYVRLNVGKESYLLRETISRTSERLNPEHFVRIHRSAIVNARKIKELIPVNSGEYVVVLKSGKELSCSRGYRLALQHLIEKNS